MEISEGDWSTSLVVLAVKGIIRACYRPRGKLPHEQTRWVVDGKVEMTNKEKTILSAVRFKLR